MKKVPQTWDFNYEFIKLDFKRQQDFSLSENIVYDLYIHRSHKSNNKNKSNVQTLEQMYLIKAPTEEMDFAVKYPPLAPHSPTPQGLHNDRCNGTY